MMLKSVFVLATLIVAPMLFGVALADRFIDIDEEPVFDADNLLLHLHTENQRLSVQLEEHALIDAPVFTLREDGGFDQYQFTDDHSSTRFFKDTYGRGNFILQLDQYGNSQMRGFVVNGTDRVVIKPASAEERRRRDTGNWHVILRREEMRPDNNNDILFPSDDVMQSYKAALNKSLAPTVRGGNIDRYVELMVFTDSEIYEEHRRALGTNDDTKITQSIKLYFSQIVASMDDRYRMSFLNDPDLRVNVKLVGYFISSKSGESTWTEGASVQVSGTPVDTNGRKTTWADVGLDVFRTWLSQHTLPVTYDYALYFTGRNIAAQGAGFSVLGIAPLGGICSSYATGASEDFMAFESAGVASHEMGHNLGSDHDGVASNPDAARCPDSDNYLMAPSIRDDVRQYTFSSCSKVQIKKLLAARTCLQNVASNEPFAASIANKYVPGQLYSLQERCTMMYGSKAVPITYDIVAQNRINICLDIACFTDPRAGSYMTQPSVAPTGTPCGDGMSCNQGKCVADANAPKGTCFMGDVATGDNSGYFSSCTNAVAPLLRAYGKKTTDELCVAVPAFKKDCCHTCKVAGGYDPASGSNSLVLGNGLPSPGATTPAATTTKATAAATTAATTKTTVVITTPRPTTTTTRVTTTTSSCGQDDPFFAEDCLDFIPYCFRNFSLEYQGWNYGLIEDVCPQSCGNC